MEKPEIIKDMRGKWNLNKPKMLSALKKSRGKEINRIFATIEDCPVEDEKGVLYSFLIEKFEFFTRVSLRGIIIKIGECIFLGIWKAEDRCIMASLPCALHVRQTNPPKQDRRAFWEILDVRFAAVIIVCFQRAILLMPSIHDVAKTGHSKKVFVFLKQILIYERMTAEPVNVEHFL